MAGCHFQLLGGMKIAIDDQNITEISSKKVKLLLAYLTLELGYPYSRKKIAFDLWPDSPEKQALSNLRKLIHDLRECCPHVDRFVKITPAYLQWNEEFPCASDVREFEQLAKGQTLYELKTAEKLYRGELMPGVYEEWLQTKRGMLAQSYLQVLEKLIHVLGSQREYSSAIQYADKLLGHDPLNEQYYRMLMRLHALNKDAGRVAAVYKQLRCTLHDEFGIAPAEETARLFHNLTRGQGEDSAVITNLGSQPSLIGRIEEWGSMLRVWNQATADHASLLVLKGGAGIGKTRLAREFKAWADSQGLCTALAGCYPSVKSLSYTPVTSWLRCFPNVQLGAVWMSELARLLPELTERYPELSAPPPIHENWQLNKWYEAMERLLLVHQPLLLVLDDIQWIDKESLQFIAYLLRSESAAKLLVLATLRTDESEDETLGQIFTDLRIEGKLTEVELAPLNRDDTQRLMAATVGGALADSHSGSLYRETGGNPLYIVETLKEWQSGGEIRQSLFVKSAIESRLSRLSDSRQLISAIAAVGRPVSTELMALVLDVNEGAILEKMEQLAQRKVLQAAGDGLYDFTHDVVRGIAYEMISASNRRICHRQIARSLIELHKERPETIAVEVVFHYELAGMEQQALPYYKLSALEAEKMYAHETMIHYSRKLCKLLPPEQQLPYVLKIGDALITVGDWGEAELTYRDWLERWGYSATLRERSLCDVAWGDCLRLQGKYEEAKMHLERSLRYFEWTMDRSGLSLVYGMLGMLHYFWGNYDQSLHYLMERMEWTDEDNEKESRIKDDCRFFGMIGFLHYDQCEYDQAIHWFKKQILLASELRDSRSISFAMGGLTLVYLDMAELNLAYDHISEKLEISRSIGDRMEFAIAMGMLGKYYLYHGHRLYATQCIAYCLEEAVAIKDWRIAAIVVGLEGRNLMEQQRYDEADRLFDLALRICRRLRTLYFTCETLYDISLLRLLQNQSECAMEAAEEALDLANQLNRKEMQSKLADLLMRIRTAAERFLPANEELYRKSEQGVANRSLELEGFGQAGEARPLPKLAEGTARDTNLSPTALLEIERYLS